MQTQVGHSLRRRATTGARGTSGSAQPIQVVTLKAQVWASTDDNKQDIQVRRNKSTRNHTTTEQRTPTTTNRNKQRTDHVNNPTTINEKTNLRLPWSESLKQTPMRFAGGRGRGAPPDLYPWAGRHRVYKTCFAKATTHLSRGRRKSTATV